MSDQVTATAAPINRVTIPDVGTITLEPLDQLRASRSQLAKDWQAFAERVATLESQAEQRFADAGAIVVPRESEASLPEVLKPQVDRAHQLVDQIRALDAQLQAFADRAHAGFRGTFSRLGDWNSGRKVQAERDKASGELRGLLVAIGRGAIASPIREAAQTATEAASLDAAAAQARAALTEKTSDLNACDAEIKLRETSSKEMGFDALYTVAYLTKYGPPAVASPLELKRGEQPLLSIAATLSRNQTRTRYVGGSHGFSFPIGHTGIRYRVGSFQGHPVSQQVLTQVDRGHVVVTTQRFAFVGGTKSVVVPLAKLVNVQVYSDGLAVFHEGRENADFFLCVAPRQVVFYVNWALNQANR